MADFSQHDHGMCWIPETPEGQLNCLKGGCGRPATHSIPIDRASDGAWCDDHAPAAFARFQKHSAFERQATGTSRIKADSGIIESADDPKHIDDAKRRFYGVHTQGCSVFVGNHEFDAHCGHNKNLQHDGGCDGCDEWVAHATEKKHFTIPPSSDGDCEGCGDPIVRSPSYCHDCHEEKVKGSQHFIKKDVGVIEDVTKMPPAQWKYHDHSKCGVSDKPCSFGCGRSSEHHSEDKYISGPLCDPCMKRMEDNIGQIEDIKNGVHNKALAKVLSFKKRVNEAVDKNICPHCAEEQPLRPTDDGCECHKACGWGKICRPCYSRRKIDKVRSDAGVIESASVEAKHDHELICKSSKVLNNQFCEWHTKFGGRPFTKYAEHAVYGIQDENNPMRYHSLSVCSGCLKRGHELGFDIKHEQHSNSTDVKSDSGVIESKKDGRVKGWRVAIKSKGGLLAGGVTKRFSSPFCSPVMAQEWEEQAIKSHESNGKSVESSISQINTSPESLVHWTGDDGSKCHSCGIIAQVKKDSGVIEGKDDEQAKFLFGKEVIIPKGPENTSGQYGTPVTKEGIRRARRKMKFVGDDKKAKEQGSIKGNVMGESTTPQQRSRNVLNRERKVANLLAREKAIVRNFFHNNDKVHREFAQQRARRRVRQHKWQHVGRGQGSANPRHLNYKHRVSVYHEGRDNKVPDSMTDQQLLRNGDIPCRFWANADNGKCSNNGFATKVWNQPGGYWHRSAVCDAHHEQFHRINTVLGSMKVKKDSGVIE